MVSYKEVQSLAGYTTLINEMEEVLDDLGNGKYRRIMVTNSKDQTQTNGMPTKELDKNGHVHSTMGGAKIVRSD